MKTVMYHSQDGGLLKMIRRTDPVIPENRPRDSAVIPLLPLAVLQCATT